MNKPRQLKDLRSVGKASLDDFDLLGISSVEQLATCKPDKLYHELCEKRGSRLDPCVLDVFSAAVAQARDPNLPKKQRDWWYWSRKRKSKKAVS